MPDSYRRLLIVAAGSIAAFFLHVFAGWAWTITAGLAVGIAVDTLGWWYGGLAVLGDWLMLLIWNLIMASGAFLRMADAMGELMGDMPAWAFIGVTLFVGFSLGALGGLIGERLRILWRQLRSALSGSEAVSERAAARKAPEA